MIQRTRDCWSISHLERSLESRLLINDPKSYRVTTLKECLILFNEKSKHACVLFHNCGRDVDSFQNTGDQTAVGSVVFSGYNLHWIFSKGTNAACRSFAPFGPQFEQEKTPFGQGVSALTSKHCKGVNEHSRYGQMYGIWLRIAGPSAIFLGFCQQWLCSSSKIAEASLLFRGSRQIFCVEGNKKISWSVLSSR